MLSRQGSTVKMTEGRIILHDRFIQKADAESPGYEFPDDLKAADTGLFPESGDRILCRLSTTISSN